MYAGSTVLNISPADLECVLCSRCLFDPVTTACGHTFCRGCLARVLDYGLACPLCMSVLAVTDQARCTTTVLDAAIRSLLPMEHQERLRAAQLEIEAVETDTQVPVFICTSAFPGVACPLYVYEPRYRLLARRCLQSNSRRFAMAAAVSSGVERFATYGTLLEVRDAVHLQDGRSILTTVGLRRFRVVNRGEKVHSHYYINVMNCDYACMYVYIYRISVCVYRMAMILLLSSIYGTSLCPRTSAPPYSLCTSVSTVRPPAGCTPSLRTYKPR